MDKTQQQKREKRKDWSWKFWHLVPIYPYSQRRTLRQEVIRDQIWTFDQLQGIFYVVVPIRMTVIRLKTGGLLVYAPVAPTGECLQLMNELVQAYGEVKYIILPTASGLEHKVFVGPFARYFPSAQVFVTPDQWSFPVNLPLSWLGFPSQRTFPLPPDSTKAPFGNEFDYALLGPINLNLGNFEEVAFLHKASGTVMVTDTVLSIPDVPPAIVQLDSYPLLFHAKDNAFDLPEDNWENRRRGWHRIALFTFYFQPSVLQIANWGKVIQEAFQAPDRSKEAYFGLYPFQWQSHWQSAFEQLRQGGRLIVAPILQKLILNRASTQTLDWVNQVSRWQFERIIPCHFSAPVTATGDTFRWAFQFFDQEIFPVPDLQLLQNINQRLSQFKIIPPTQ